MLDADRLPPQNLDAEVNLLGSFMLAPSLVAEVEINPDDFYSPDHRLIYEALCRLNDAGKLGSRTDLFLLTEELRAAETLDRIGGLPYLTSILERVPSSANAEYYAEHVRQAAFRRRTIHACTTISRACYDPTVPVDDAGDGQANLRDVIDNALCAVSSDEGSSRAMSVGDALADVLAEAAGERPGRRIMTGWFDWDDLLGGLWAGDLVVIGGRPSKGKTTLALNLALRLTMPDSFHPRLGHGPQPVLVCSIETQKQGIIRRILANMADVDGMALRKGVLSREEHERVLSWVPSFQAAPMLVDDAYGQTAGSIRRAALRARAKLGGLSAVVVDYLQLMGRDKGSTTTNRTEQVGADATAMKRLARECDTCVILLSQLNRATELRDDAVPQVSDLRQSGEIEQAADVIVLMHVPGDAQGQLNGIVAKQRDGATGSVTWLWSGSRHRLDDLAVAPSF